MVINECDGLRGLDDADADDDNDGVEDLVMPSH